MTRVRAIQALRLNYKWRGVYLWLKGRKKSTGERGWRQVWSDPEKVIQEQHAIADGAFL